MPMSSLRLPSSAALYWISKAPRELTVLTADHKEKNNVAA